MAGKIGLQILRADENYVPSAGTEVLKDGQPLYSKKYKQLYIGDGISEVSELNPITSNLYIDGEGCVTAWPFKSVDKAELDEAAAEGKDAFESNRNKVNGRSSFTLGNGNINGAYQSIVGGESNVIPRLFADEPVSGVKKFSIGDIVVSGAGNKVCGSHNGTFGYRNIVSGARSLVTGTSNEEWVSQLNKGSFDAYKSYILYGCSDSGMIYADESKTTYFKADLGEGEQEVNIVDLKFTNMGNCNNIIGGDGNESKTKNSLIVGTSNTVHTAASFVAGNNNKLKYETESGPKNTSVTTANYKNNFVLGDSNVIRGKNHFILGNENIAASGDGAEGLNNIKIIGDSNTVDAVNNTIIIGSGISNPNGYISLGKGSEALVITSNNAVQVKSAPSTDYDVVRKIDVSDTGSLGVITTSILNTKLNDYVTKTELESDYPTSDSLKNYVSKASLKDGSFNSTLKTVTAEEGSFNKVYVEGSNVVTNNTFTSKLKSSLASTTAFDDTTATLDRVQLKRKATEASLKLTDAIRFADMCKKVGTQNSTGATYAALEVYFSRIGMNSSLGFSEGSGSTVIEPDKITTNELVAKDITGNLDRLATENKNIIDAINEINAVTSSLDLEFKHSILCKVTSDDPIISGDTFEVIIKSSDATKLNTFEALIEYFEVGQQLELLNSGLALTVDHVDPGVNYIVISYHDSEGRLTPASIQFTSIEDNVSAVITGESSSTSTVELDMTLTEEGKAADAKATGARCTELEELIETYYEDFNTKTNGLDEDINWLAGMCGDYEIRISDLENSGGSSGLYIHTCYFSGNEVMDQSGDSITLKFLSKRAERYERPEDSNRDILIGAYNDRNQAITILSCKFEDEMPTDIHYAGYTEQSGFALGHNNEYSMQVYVPMNEEEEDARLGEFVDSVRPL